MANEQQRSPDMPRESQGGGQMAGQAQQGGSQMGREAQGGAQAQAAYQATPGAPGYVPEEKGVSGWQLGLVTFAGVLMIMNGFFHFINGLSAIIEPDFYELTRAYAFDMSLDAWGWLLIVTGIVLMLAGFFVFTGNIVARLIGIVASLISAVISFFAIPYYPVWSIIAIAVNIGVIWALATYGRSEAEGAGESVGM
jgi:hypothetical protein